MTQPPPQRSALWQALGFAWQFGYTVAVPLVVFTLAGRLIDKRFDTHPWFLIVGVVLSITISSIALVVRASKIIAQYTKDEPPTNDSHGNFPRR